MTIAVGDTYEKIKKVLDRECKDHYSCPCLCKLCFVNKPLAEKIAEELERP